MHTPASDIETVSRPDQYLEALASEVLEVGRAHALQAAAVGLVLLAAGAGNAQVGTPFSMNDCLYQPFVASWRTGERVLTSSVTCHIGPNRRASDIIDNPVAINCDRLQVNWWDPIGLPVGPNRKPPGWAGWRTPAADMKPVVAYVCAAGQ
jgi:hypothetical protein